MTRYHAERPQRNKFRAAVATAKSKSAVANGKRLHAVARGDTVWTRRFRDIYAEIINDLGGIDLLSEAQRQLVRRCATIAIACEEMEGHAVLGEEINLDLYGALTDRLGRTFQRLGLKRVARNVTPDLKQYLSRNGNGHGDEEGDDDR